MTRQAIREVQRHIKQANQARLAEDAIAQMLAKLGGAVS
jgi:hypothetical protein